MRKEKAVKRDLAIRSETKRIKRSIASGSGMNREQRRILERGKKK